MLRDDFPFGDTFEQFLDEYARCTTYWYVPKARTLNDENITVCAVMLEKILDEFLDRQWHRHTQDDLLTALIDDGVLEPTTEGDITDRTALPRIIKKLLETLGLMWVEDDLTINITNAGLDLITAHQRDEVDEMREIVSRQVAKYQYPKPGDADYAVDFNGLVPHLFLLQVLDEVGAVSYAGYEFFVNLAQSHDDLGRILEYIRCWNDLSGDEREELRDVAERLEMSTVDGQLNLDQDLRDRGEGGTRYRRIYNDRSYQLNFFTYPHYVELDEDDAMIRAADPGQVEDVVSQAVPNLKVTTFDDAMDWFAYFGNPEHRPSWFTHLTFQVEQAESEQEAREVVEPHRERLTDEEEEQIDRLQLEKKVEDFYEDSVELIEEGLTLVEDGRQYNTGVGPIDLLCRDEDGMYVVVEIKVEDASDSAFGQIQRYMGWIHRHLDDGRDNVRGIILAGIFPQSARYSRIGLLRNDYDEVIKFKKHGLHAQDI